LAGVVFRAADAKPTQIDKRVEKGKQDERRKKAQKTRREAGKTKREAVLKKSKRELRYAIILRLLYEVSN
jgi:hypothetical protein